LNADRFIQAITLWWKAGNGKFEAAEASWSDKSFGASFIWLVGLVGFVQRERERDHKPYLISRGLQFACKPLIRNAANLA
jgi:hypothetical protein